MSVSQTEKIFFVEHLSLMLKGGSSITESLETLREEAKSKSFKRALENILKSILEGESLSDSFKKYPRIFNNFFQNIVKVGEESGTLEENLLYLRSYLENEASLRKKVTGALLYPAIIITLALVIALSVAFFILPRITNLFLTLDIELPLATRILIGFSNLLKNDWHLILIGVVLLFILVKIVQRLKFTKFYFDRIILSLPFFSGIIKKIILARLSRNFYILLKSGVPILETLDICIDIAENEIYKRKLILIRSELERGEGISKSLKDFPKYFPPIFSRMILVGEKSGTLEESFLYLAEYYEKDVDSVLKNLSALLEPVLLIVVGGLVLFVALAIIVPIYQFTGGIRTR